MLVLSTILSHSTQKYLRKERANIVWFAFDNSDKFCQNHLPKMGNLLEEYYAARYSNNGSFS